MQDQSPSPTRDRIVCHVREQIVSGQWRPGARLPARRELGKEFDTTLITVQRAFERLVRDGFVIARGKSGTFVVDHPPHLFRYGLIFSCAPSHDRGMWPRFWEALCNEAVAIDRSQSRRMQLFYDIDLRPDNPKFRRLVQDVQGRRLAGLIFANDPSIFSGTALLNDGTMPRVAIVQHPPDGIPALVFNMPSVVEGALDYLAARKRKRVAFISLPGVEMEPDYHAQIAEAVTRRGMIWHPYWCQDVHRSAARAARNAVHLLMHDGQRERPNALVITDDNLVEHATAGLLDAGVRVPQDVEVVAHCNFPWPTPCLVPARRIGFDVTQVLGMCIDLIDLQRRGEPPPAATVLEAAFEEDVARAKVRRARVQ